MARMIKLFIFTIVITQLFIASGCGELGKYVHDAPGNVGDQKFLYQLIGQSRETVFAELGRPDLKITQNERQFLMYINIVDSTSYGAVFFVPLWGTSEDIAATCLRIELESNSLVKGFKIRKFNWAYYYPSIIRNCLDRFWSKKQLQQTYTQVDDYLELMIVDPNTAARMLCENADDGYPLARYMLGDIYSHVGAYLSAYVWYSLYNGRDTIREDWVEITGLDAKELDNALQEWQPGQCEPEIISKIITDNHAKLFEIPNTPKYTRREITFSETWNYAVWRSDSLRTDKETTNIYAPAITTEPVNFTGDFSGTYISSTSDSVVRIIQDGNKISGSYGNRGGKFWGDIEGNTISYDWTSPAGSTGTGKLSFTIGSSEVTGTWVNRTTQKGGKSNLIKVE